MASSRPDINKTTAKRRRAKVSMTLDYLASMIGSPDNFIYAEIDNNRRIISFYMEGKDFPLCPEAQEPVELDFEVFRRTTSPHLDS